jgi:hypothetical protein
VLRKLGKVFHISATQMARIDAKYKVSQGATHVHHHHHHSHHHQHHYHPYPQISSSSEPGTPRPSRLTPPRLNSPFLPIRSRRRSDRWWRGRRGVRGGWRPRSKPTCKPPRTGIGIETGTRQDPRRAMTSRHRGQGTPSTPLHGGRTPPMTAIDPPRGMPGRGIVTRIAGPRRITRSIGGRGEVWEGVNRGSFGGGGGLACRGGLLFVCVLVGI